MSDVYSICQELISNSSKNYKGEILEREKRNAEFRMLLNFLLNPFVLTGMSTTRINKKLSIEPEQKIDTLRDLFDYLSRNHSGRDADVAIVQNFISRNVGREDFFRALLSKELKLGISAKTVNKVFEEKFIPIFEVMTAEKYTEFPDWIKGKHFFITNKIDGNRCILYKDGNAITMYAGRSGQLLDGFTEIEDAARKLPVERAVIDGELTLQDSTGLTSIEQYQKATAIIRKKGPKKGAKLIAFDWIPYDEFFNTHIGKAPYSERRKVLEQICGKTKETDFIYVLPVLCESDDPSIVQEWKEWAIKTENEGVMINVGDAVYQYKRTRDILKVKVQEDSDLMITGFELGKTSGKYANTLGAILCEYKGGTVRVGGGLSDELRDEIWNNQDKWLGRVIAVKHNGETVDSDTNQLSIRFPRFKELRDEGKEVNY